MEITEQELADRVQEWGFWLADLGVSHFRINDVSMNEDSPSDDPDAIASVITDDKYDSCEFWFSKAQVENWTEEELDETIIHEWLHVAMRDYDQAVDGMFSYYVPTNVYYESTRRLIHEREGIIERLARTLLAFYNQK